ncbi:MAG: SRPBCC domain-containing protein [Methylocystis sp.]
MSKIETRIEINAPPERVWAVLTDFREMPSWNPFIRSIAGPLTAGERLNVLIEPPGRSSMSFKPVLLAAKPARELRWRGSFLAESLFAGEHFFLIDRRSAQNTLMRQGETFSGLLAPLIMNGAMLQATRAGFVAMNEALKRRAET